MPLHTNMLTDPHIRLLVATTALCFIAIEYGLSRLIHRDLYDMRESATSLGMAIGQTISRGVGAVIFAVPFAFVWQHRVFDFDQTSVLALVGLFVGSEFVYYWHHRASHTIRWMWATHSVHHSATRLNLSAAIRLGWTNNLSGGFIFFLPLVWIGFHPLAVTGIFALNLFYQFFIHTELVPTLGPLEWVLNTPAHHRVHHAANTECLDRNYGGVLIVFDRLFGTLASAPKNEPLRYGLVGATPTFNPLQIAFGEWAAMLRDAWHAPSLKQKFAALLRLHSPAHITPEEV
jgi:sterol desaturase/sphingolipid hydroxylase (fatty acid hydroxylase superfamily)